MFWHAYFLATTLEKCLRYLIDLVVLQMPKSIRLNKCYFREGVKMHSFIINMSRRKQWSMMFLVLLFLFRDMHMKNKN